VVPLPPPDSEAALVGALTEADLRPRSVWFEWVLRPDNLVASDDVAARVAAAAVGDGGVSVHEHPWHGDGEAGGERSDEGGGGSQGGGGSSNDGSSSRGGSGAGGGMGRDAVWMLEGLQGLLWGCPGFWDDQGTQGGQGATIGDDHVSSGGSSVKSSGADEAPPAGASSSRVKLAAHFPNGLVDASLLELAVAARDVRAEHAGRAFSSPSSSSSSSSSSGGGGREGSGEGGRKGARPPRRLLGELCCRYALWRPSVDADASATGRADGGGGSGEGAGAGAGAGSGSGARCGAAGPHPETSAGALAADWRTFVAGADTAALLNADGTPSKRAARVRGCLAGNRCLACTL